MSIFIFLTWQFWKQLIQDLSNLRHAQTTQRLGEKPLYKTTELPPLSAEIYKLLWPEYLYTFIKPFLSKHCWEPARTHLNTEMEKEIASVLLQKIFFPHEFSYKVEFL